MFVFRIGERGGPGLSGRPGLPGLPGLRGMVSRNRHFRSGNDWITCL